MRTAHLYMFLDGSPSDWLVDNQDEKWHTIAFYNFQSDPLLQPFIEDGMHFHNVLDGDLYFKDMFSKLTDVIPGFQLRKWKTGMSYRSNFMKSFQSFQPISAPIINAYSFQEKTLRSSKSALLASYNLTRTENDIGFMEFRDEKGRLKMRHEFVNFDGYHVVERLENQMLVLLFMAWGIADQFRFYWNDMVSSGKYGFDQLSVTVVSDKLSGDDEIKRESENNLRHLLNPYSDVPIALTRSPESDSFAADLFVDNMAGLLNTCIENQTGDLVQELLSFPLLNTFSGWNELLPSEDKLNLSPVIPRLKTTHGLL